MKTWNQTELPKLKKTSMHNHRHINRLFKPLGTFHRDERGAMTFVTLFTVLMLAFLLGMILNVCRLADAKIRMQYAADAATYSSGVVMARGMNSLAFTNHLLCDVFALTAFLQVGNTVNNEDYSDAPDDLALALADTYRLTGEQNFNIPDLPKNNWHDLPAALAFGGSQNRVMVETFSAWVKNFSDEVLPSLEMVLEDELIPKYQRMLTKTIGEMVQQTAHDVATRNIGGNREGMSAAIWRTDGQETNAWQFGKEDTPPEIPSGLPVVDPVNSPDSHSLSADFYMRTARAQRDRLAKTYLAQWNNEKLLAFNHLDGMSQFTTIWRGTTEKKLERLLKNNDVGGDNNLLHVIWTPRFMQEYAAELRSQGVSTEDLRPYLSFMLSAYAEAGTPAFPEPTRNDELRDCYMFVGVVKQKQFSPFMPSLFTNPLSSVSGEQRLTFAQGLLCLTVPRLTYHTFPEPCCKITVTEPSLNIIPQEQNDTKKRPKIIPGNVSSRIEYRGNSTTDMIRQHHGIKWNLLNQNWQFKLCPARCAGLKQILAKNDPVFQRLQQDDFERINTH